MVATRFLTYGPPITASPARPKADPTQLPFIRAWITDFPVESISVDHAQGAPQGVHAASFTTV